MPILTYSIGGEQFEDLVGNVQKRGQQLQRFARPGLDGAGYRFTGKRTGQFTLTSKHYVATFLAAESALITYQTLIEQDPVAVIQHSINLGTYKVLSVVQVNLLAVESVNSSTIITDPKALQYCRWTLEG